MNNLEKLLERAIQNFDFQKVLNVSKQLGFKWKNIDQMKQYVRMLFNDAIRCAFQTDSDYGLAGTGGFQVSIQKSKQNGKNNFYVKIKFVIEEWQQDSEGYEYDQKLKNKED